MSEPQRSSFGLPFWPEELDHGFPRADSPGQLPLVDVDEFPDATDRMIDAMGGDDDDQSWCDEYEAGMDDDPDEGGPVVFAGDVQVTATAEDGEPVL